MARSSPAVPVIIALALFLSVVIAFASLLVTVTAETPENNPTSDTPENQHAAPLTDHVLLKMKVKQLKAILENKGPDAACLACTSKQEYVSRIRETFDWPDITPDPTPASEDPSMEDLQKMFSQGNRNEEIMKLRKTLEEAGVDTSKMFTAGGIDREEIEREMKKWQDLKVEEDANEANDADGAKSDL